MENATVAVLVPTSIATPASSPVDSAVIQADPNATKMVRADRLQQFLEKNNARRLWESQQPGVTVSCYSILGTVVIVTVFAGRNRAGWELYVPAAKSNKIEDTLASAAAFIGNGCAA